MTRDSSPYAAAVRRIEASVDLDFYSGGTDEDSDILLNDVNVGKSDARIRQLVTKGLKPEYKYATLDGHTLLDGTCILYGGASGIPFPIYAPHRFISGDTEESEPGQSGKKPGYPFSVGKDKLGDCPAYSIVFNGAREIDHATIIGEQQWGQGPTAYTLILHEENGTRRELEFRKPTDCVEQRIEFEMCTCTRVDLVITHWNAPHTAAKLMYFGFSETMNVASDEIESLTVLEEKSAEADSLSYGIIANTCTVKIKNAGNRFLDNLDFLKRNRRITPKLACTDASEERNARPDEYVSLGVFFSDRWEISATSQFVKCEAYDALYALRDLYLYYLMDCGEDGFYVLDGTENYGTTPSNHTRQDGYPIRVNTIGAVFRKIFWLINRKRAQNGVFNAEIRAEIDPILDTIPIACVPLGYDTAWNMLQEAALFALSYVYVDRAGVIHVVRDRFADEGAAAPTDSGVTIDPSVSYRFNLPSTSRLIVNRVKASFGNLKDNTEDIGKLEFTIARQNLEVLEHGNIYRTGFAFEKQLRKFQVSVTLSESYETEVSCDAVGISFAIQNQMPEVTISIKNIQAEFQKQNVDRDFSSSASERRYGSKPFDYKSSLITTDEEASARAERILARYADGFSYVETEWRGDPAVVIGSGVTAYTRIPSEGEEIVTEPTKYEVLSHELTIEKGLRATVKALQIKGSA